MQEIFAYLLRYTYKKKGLSQLDAEGVIWHSSPYKGTAESQSATKKYIL